MEIAQTIKGLRGRAADWLGAEIQASGLFEDVRVSAVDTVMHYSTEMYLRLVQTYSGFRARDPQDREPVLGLVDEAIDAHGGRIATRSPTTLGLARVTSHRKRAD
jgi:hypothetical protein